MMRTRDAELDVIRPAITTPAMLSCYLLPEFWAGTAATRAAPEVVRLRIVREEETSTGRRTLTTRVVEARPHEPTEDEARANEEMLKAIDACRRAALAGRDLAALSAFHRWLGQGTSPPKSPEEELEQ